MSAALATIAIIGRPNVGKSTLFNRLVGKRLALVDNTPGVTRDRRVGTAKLGDLTFDVMDTAGLEEAAADSLQGRMTAQTQAAIGDADVLLFVVDARSGITPADSAFAELVRRAAIPTVLVANKVESQAGEAGVFDAFSLGLGEPIGISAEHGEGMADLYEALQPHVDRLGEERAFLEIEADADLSLDEAMSVDEDQEADVVDNVDLTKPLSITVLGRPNVGKSTLINQMIGEERLLTGPEAGITRDSISLEWTYRDRRIKLIDTAGLRRKAKVQQKLEKLSVADSLRSMKFSQVVVLLLDALQPFERQDMQLADLIAREGRAVVIAVNKWDLVEEHDAVLRELREAADRLLPQLRGVPVMPVSAYTGRGLDKLMAAIFAQYAVWNRRVSTARLNQWLDAVVARHPPPAVAGRRLKLRFMTQPKMRPPHFVVFCSRPEALPDAYQRYLIAGLRETFGLPGVPIRLSLRKGNNPYAGRAKKK